MRRWHSSGDQRAMHARKRFELKDRYYSHGYTGRRATLGYWRWRHPWDCSKTRCAICHFEKFYEPKARHNKKLAAIKHELSL